MPLNADSLPRTTDLRPLLPFYLVIFVAFIGYALVGTFFVPTIMHDHGFLPPGTATSQRTLVPVRPVVLSPATSPAGA